MRKTIAALAAALMLAGIAGPATATTGKPVATVCYDGKGLVEPCYNELFSLYVAANAQVGADIATIAAQQATIAHQRVVIKRLRHRLAAR